MKKIELIVFIGLGLAISSGFLLFNSSIAFLASFYQLTTGFTFFMLNLTLGVTWLQRKETGTFLLRSALPFLLAYSVCVVLYTFYWVSLSKDAVFQLEYILRSFPHKESLLLIGLYFLGLFYGYFRRNRKALKLTFALLVTLLLLVTLYLQPFKSSLPEINGVQFIDDHYTSITELINLPQFKNKTVYIDLWYSSCAPCIKQFKNHLPILKNKLDSNQVSYLYLGRETSHLNSKQRWINAISKYQLKGWHYYFPKNDEPVIWNEIRKNTKLKLTGYPHYLIASKGKIISYNAPKPSELDDPEILKRFF